MNLRFIFPVFFLLPAALQAQSCGFSEGKNLSELRSAVFNRPSAPFRIFSGGFFIQQLNINTPTSLNPVFLPKWSAEELPFFCKIEHDWGQKSRLPLKFRLGSVEYVDWLEGK